MISTHRLRQRAAVIRAVRVFFEERDFLEVETPVRLPVLAPEVWIEPETSGTCFLQTSPELCMKRLLAAGHASLFQICRCFRRGERGRLHLPEFSMLEWYRLGGQVSVRQWRDALGVLGVQGERLDVAYMRNMAVELGVSDLLERALCKESLFGVEARDGRC